MVLCSNIISNNRDIISLCGTALGVTALIFVAKGDVWGHIICAFFCILYGISSYQTRYYGELITYVGMSLPATIFSIFSWLRHPFASGHNEVKIHRLTKKEFCIVCLVSVVGTIIFYFILKALNTASLLFSTFSITTSLFASLLTFYRNPYYAVAYMVNDVVLIILWSIASFEAFSKFPMVICFFMFFVNDLYGFISWKKREKIQRG